MERVILHSDLNSFYASVALLSRPELRGLPIAVGGSPKERHGIVLTANPIAKQFGVRTGEALWLAQQKCPALVVVAPDHESYRRYSRLVHQIYLDYTDRVEPFGIDECWLDVTGSVELFGSGEHMASEIRARVKRELALTVSIGVSYNKIFAKLGSDYKKPDATTVITRENFRTIVWPLSCSDLLGVGAATRERLLGCGIQTIGQLAQCEPELLQRLFGKMGGVLWAYANGMDCAPVAVYGKGEPIKSVGNSVTTPRDMTTNEDANRILYILADSVASRLRAKGLRGRLITVSMRDTKLHTCTHQGQLAAPSCLSGEIAEKAFALFREVYHWRIPLRSMGLTVGELSSNGEPAQISLYENETHRQKQERIESAVDSLRGKFGHLCVRRAVQMEDEEFSRIDTKRGCTLRPEE